MPPQLLIPASELKREEAECLIQGKVNSLINDIEDYSKQAIKNELIQLRELIHRVDKNI